MAAVIAPPAVPPSRVQTVFTENLLRVTPAPPQPVLPALAVPADAAAVAAHSAAVTAILAAHAASSAAQFKGEHGCSMDGKACPRPNVTYPGALPRSHILEAALVTLKAAIKWAASRN